MAEGGAAVGSDAQANQDIQMDQEEMDQIHEEVQQEAIVPNSQPPQVPADGTYITALNEAGVDQKRIEQLQQNVEGNEADADEFNIMR
jgi:hypothetical protein